MMDAVGLALSIAALYTTCRDCYGFFTTVKNADADSSAHMRDLEIQQSILKAWGFHWQIQREEDGEPQQATHIGRKQNKLHEYLSNNRFKAEGVFRTLSALADTLSDQGKLVKRYGIRFQPSPNVQTASEANENVQLVISNTTIEQCRLVVDEVQTRLSMLNKFKWAMKDKENFKKLIALLKSHSESLYRLCPENAFESMNIYLMMECLSTHDSPNGLRWTSTLATQHANIEEDSSVREGYKLLASAATLKASVNENRDAAYVNGRVLDTIQEEQPEIWYLGKGLALSEGQVVYVEVRDYRGPPLELTAEQKEQLKRQDRARMAPHPRAPDGYGGLYGTYAVWGEEEEDMKPIEIVRPADPKLRALIQGFYSTFKDANMRESVNGLDIAGMIDHTAGQYKDHCSILYKLPGTTGIQSPGRPAENLKLRAPVTLHSLLGKVSEKGICSTLGARFELARKLVRAVCLLHSSGWLHKNIRAESVIFFPENGGALIEDGYEADLTIDVS